MAWAMSSEADFGVGELVARQRAHLGVERGIGEEGRQLRPLFLLVAERPDRPHDRLKVVELSRERRIFGAADPLRQARADLLVPAQDEIEIVVGGHGREPEEKERQLAALEAHAVALGEFAQGFAQRGVVATRRQHRRDRARRFPRPRVSGSLP